MEYDPVKDRKETPPERLDRQLIELLNEVRVAIPGVQVLFAFLLTVPFTAAWDETTRLQQDVYFATLLATAVATPCSSPRARCTGCSSSAATSGTSSPWPTG